MDVTRIDEGLWRWASPHPAWAPGATWDPVVGSTFVDTGTEIVLVDPFVPVEPGEAERFWRALDRDVERAGSAPTVVLTTRRHAWSAADVRGRYPGAQVLAPDAEREETLRAMIVDGWFGPGESLPTGIRSHPSGDPGEAALWLAAHRTLVVGNVLVGADDGTVVHGEGIVPGVAPADAVSAALRPLLALPIERILPSHGVPVLAEGHAALAAALGG